MLIVRPCADVMVSGLRLNGGDMEGMDRQPQPIGHFRTHGRSCSVAPDPASLTNDHHSVRAVSTKLVGWSTQTVRLDQGRRHDSRKNRSCIEPLDARHQVRHGERRMMYTCVSDLAACCADSRRYESLLTRSSLIS